MKTIVANPRLWTNLMILIISIVPILILANIIAAIIDVPYGLLVLNSIGMLAWAALSKWIIDLSLIQVPFQMAWVTMNIFSKVTTIWAQGLGLTYVWEQLQPHKAIDLLRHTVIIEEKGVGPDAETYTSQDSILLYAKWSMLIRPDPEHLDKYLQFDPEDIRRQFRDFTNQCLSDMAAKLDASDVMKSKGTLATNLSKIYGGEKHLSDMEEKYGVKVGDPILADIDQDPEVLKAKQAVVKTMTVQEAAEGLVAAARKLEDKTLTMDRAIERVLQITGAKEINQTIYDVRGLEGIQHLAFGGMHGLPGVSGGGGDASKGKGKQSGGGSKS